MVSEAIVVLVLIALAFFFVIWVRRNSHDHSPSGQYANLGKEGEKTHDIK